MVCNFDELFMGFNVRSIPGIYLQVLFAMIEVLLIRRLEPIITAKSTDARRDYFHIYDVHFLVDRIHPLPLFSIKSTFSLGFSKYF